MGPLICGMVKQAIASQYRYIAAPTVEHVARFPQGSFPHGRHNCRGEVTRSQQGCKIFDGLIIRILKPDLGEVFSGEIGAQMHPDVSILN